MSILHRATITPTKAEVLATVLGRDLPLLGAYRLDDPAGEVGVEGYLLQDADAVVHVVLSYRGAPLEGVAEVATMQHSVLGSRWIYRGGDDPVARACVAAALAGTQEQAVEEVYDGDELVLRREPTVRIARVAGSADVSGSELEAEEGEPQLLDVVASDAGGRTHLRATWDGGSGVVALLG
ncbi:hypothetical protein K8Z61_06125 [Nocardioides sp. TRM66260-LWL]|uniref:maltokinase N-terminal cap-like domain-containing protein n=1 Tax=Nocardioides sp. TRM66260-LWL TaxID=2874478 RepID=UPI001CC7C744|nr:hypothetical protein [Nocardioides sp. TRM66260-LWL]MBZ5734069.1 hypothetical protein [Nocardioides sp. TRM66260-LWL]